MTTQRRPALLAFAVLLVFWPVAPGATHPISSVPAHPAPLPPRPGPAAGGGVAASDRHDESAALAAARMRLGALDRAQAPARASRGAARPAAAGDPGLIWPVDGPVTSGYGTRSGRMHEGLDISAPSATPIRAAKDGIVVFSGTEDGYGNEIVVDHGGGVSTLYAHASRLAVTVGEHVRLGQVIAYVGSTGRSTGVHLHFETHVGGRVQDPRRLLP